MDPLGSATKRKLDPLSRVHAIERGTSANSGKMDKGVGPCGWSRSKAITEKGLVEWHGPGLPQRPTKAYNPPSTRAIEMAEGREGRRRE
jgi:hypothetical protein